MKFRLNLCLVLFLLGTTQLHAQSVAINTDGSTANASAMLDVKGSNKVCSSHA